MKLMDGTSQRLRQTTIANLLITAAWLAWGFTAVGAIYRKVGIAEGWWLCLLTLGPATIAACCSLLGFHRRAAVSFLLASLVVGSGVWLFIVGPLAVLLNSLFA